VVACGVAVLATSTLGAAGGDLRVLTAVKAGDRAAVRSAMRAKADINAAEPDGTTALHWAVRADDLETTRMLLAAGANAKAANRYGVTPISLAAMNGNATLIEALLKAGADPNTVMGEGETVLMTASRTGNVEAMRVLLASGAKVNAKEQFLGETALMWAAGEGHLEATRTLLEAGADVQAVSTVLDTPKLSFPRSGGPNTPFPRGGWTAVMYAARQGAADTVRALADAGANLNVQDPDGTTALVFAIINAHYDSAAVLIEKGADPNIGDLSGMAALYAAVDIHTVRWNFGRPAPFITDKLTAVDVVKLLLEHGANPNARLKRAMLARHRDAGDRQLNSGSTPLMRAVKTADVPMVKLLLDHGADGTLTQPNGTTVLMIAAGVGSPALDAPNEVEAPRVWKANEDAILQTLALCENRCGDVNAFNADGTSALFGALGRGERTVTWLLEHGARTDIKNKTGQTPYDVAMGVGPRSARLGAAAQGPPKRENIAAIINKYAKSSPVSN
jgi:ankyrin repeat protein